MEATTALICASVRALVARRRNVHRPLGASSEDLVRHCLRFHLRDAVDLLELLEELGLGRVARLLPRAEGGERDLVRGKGGVIPSPIFLFFSETVGLKKVASGTVVAILKSRQPPHTARLTTAPSRSFSLGRYSSTRSAISTRAAELALPVCAYHVHACACVCNM